MKKLWIVLTAYGLFATNYGKEGQHPNVHDVCASEEAVKRYAAEHGATAERFFDTDMYTWGSSNETDGVRFWAVPVSADVRQLREVLGLQWFGPKRRLPEKGAEVVVWLSDNAQPMKARYVADGVFHLLGYHEGQRAEEAARAGSVLAWRPLPAKDEAWPVAPSSFNVEGFDYGVRAELPDLSTGF